MKLLPVSFPREMFRNTAAVILFTAAVAKIWMVVYSEPITAEHEPLTGLRYDIVFSIMAAAELGCSIVLLVPRAKHYAWHILVALCSLLALYRLGLWLIDYRLPCSCLGVLPEWLGIPKPKADTLTKILLAYLVAGSYFFLIIQRLEQRTRHDQEFQ